MQAVPGHQVPAPIRTAGMTMAPAAYISLAEPLGAAGAGKAEVRCAPHAAAPSMETTHENMSTETVEKGTEAALHGGHFGDRSSACA